MKKQLTIRIATALSVASSAVFSGCSRQPKPSQPKIVYVTNAPAINMEQAELIYLNGWIQGFNICHDINSGTITNEDAAYVRQATEKNKYLSSLNR